METALRRTPALLVIVPLFLISLVPTVQGAHGAQAQGTKKHCFAYPYDLAEQGNTDESKSLPSSKTCRPDAL